MILNKFVFLFIFVYFSGCVESKLEIFYRWKELAYKNIPSPNAEFAFATTESTPLVVPKDNIPMGVSHHKGRLFICVPRRRVGIPATLNVINMNKVPKTSISPHLTGYPSYETNFLEPDMKPDEHRIVSVYRTRVDECERLWFIDTGLLEYPDDNHQVQPPSIWVINLKNDQVVRRFELPASLEARMNGLASITVDVDPNDCNNAFGYMPDLASNRLHVYSFRENRAWSFQHQYFHHDPNYKNLSIGNVNFAWDDGIFSLTLKPKGGRGFREAYFHPMIGVNEYVVSTRILRNESLSTRSNHGHDFILLGKRGEHSQSTMHEYDPKTGVIFYADVGRSAVSCWNTNKEFSAENHHVIAQDDTEMVYPCDLSVDKEGTLWVMTNTLPTYIYSDLDYDKYNFKIWKDSTFKAIKGTGCAA